MDKGKGKCKGKSKGKTVSNYVMTIQKVQRANRMEQEFTRFGNNDRICQAISDGSLQVDHSGVVAASGGVTASSFIRRIGKCRTISLYRSTFNH